MPLEIGADHRCLDREGLAERTGEAEAGVGGVHHQVARGQDLGDVLAVTEDVHGLADAAPEGPVAQGEHTRRRGAHEEQARVRQRVADARHRLEHVVVAPPGADADLGDEGMLRAQAELRPDAPAVHPGVEAPEVRPRVDDLDLLGGDAGPDEPALDGLADRHHRGHLLRGVAEAVPAVEREAHPAIEDEDRDPHRESGEHGQGPGASLLAVYDLDLVLADEPGERPRGGKIDAAPHRDRRVLDVGGGARAAPVLVRARRHYHVVAAPGQPQREIAELDGRAGEEVRLRIELENVHARLTRSRSAPAAHRTRKNSLTAAMTSSTSASVWPAEIGSVRISFTMRSVRGRAGGSNDSTAGCWWLATG